MAILSCDWKNNLNDLLREVGATLNLSTALGRCLDRSSSLVPSQMSNIVLQTVVARCLLAVNKDPLFDIHNKVWYTCLQDTVRALNYPLRIQGQACREYDGSS